MAIRSTALYITSTYTSDWILLCHHISLLLFDHLLDCLFMILDCTSCAPSYAIPYLINDLHSRVFPLFGYPKKQFWNIVYTDQLHATYITSTAFLLMKANDLGEHRIFSYEGKAEVLVSMFD
jgi:hypothetical protein